MKQAFLFLCCFLFFVSLLERQLFKANHGFSLHVIEAPFPALSDPIPSVSFPAKLFQQPFHYLGKGAQSFVFESEDKQTVLKFYRFPSQLRRFPWARSPIHYLFSPSHRQLSAAKAKLAFHSFYLAAQPLVNETGALYVHLQPTHDLRQKAHLIDRLGTHYQLPLDSVVFVLQKKGIPFLAQFKKELALHNIAQCKKMLDGLIHLIRARCAHNISDLDNMANDNYGWLEDHAIHLDIGRFQEKALLSDPLHTQEEILRITHPLTVYLSKVAPELYTYFLSASAPESLHLE